MSSLDNSNNEDNPTKDETNRGQEITNMDEASKENSPVEKILECMLMCCKECEKRYSDERVPRNLSCGHTMCTECLDKCLSDQKQCPECREKQLAKSALHLPINYPLLRVIRSILNKEIDVKDIIMPEIPVHEPVCDKYQDGGQCPVHSSPLVFLCVSCSMWVCQDCLVVDHPYLPRGSCKILNLKNAMDDIKREYKRKVELSNSDVESIHQKFESVVDKNKMCSKFECCGERGHLRLVQEIDSGIENLKREAETTVMKFRNRLNELSETVDKTLSQKVLTSSCEELMVSLAKFKAYVDAEKERSSPVNQNIYIHFRMVSTTGNPFYI
ncbi:hypothetical protein SK128_010955 [Halocaridina rubra]|uniref:RING-type domain-containing protein n=1 Tax=Halocaridina rubra TaxID=373956 RepID=A0AAN8XA38_HALRR